MEEDKLLEELRQQRNVIRKHLDWLEQKISKLESGEEADDQPIAEDASKPHKVAPFLHKETEAEKETEEKGSDKELHRYKPPTGDEVLRAKIGCLVLFVLSTTLFLFLLFGLPYLMD